MRSARLLLVALLLTGGPLTGCSLGYNLHDRYTFDLVDGGMDAGPVCEPACGTEAPICDAVLGCIECLSDVDCPLERPACSPETHLCGDCTTSEQCARFVGNRHDICDPDRGSCVECILDGPENCSGNETCDVFTGECARAPIDTVEPCNPCTNDDQCRGDFVCVPTDFRGEHHGYFCLGPTSDGCISPFQANAEMRTSANGRVDRYCTVNEELTTCEAFWAHFLNRDCDVDDDCPQPGGLCRVIRSRGRICTYPCTSSLECFESPGVDVCEYESDAISYCGDGETSRAGDLGDTPERGAIPSPSELQAI